MFKLRKHALIYDTILKDWGIITTSFSKNYKSITLRYQKKGWLTLNNYDPKRFEVWG